MATLTGFKNFVAPEIGYPKKIKKKQFEKTPGGSVNGNVFRPHGTLGITRGEMPQLKDRTDFLNWLTSLGVDVELVHTAPESLVVGNRISFAQDRIYLDRALKKIKKQGALSKPILLSSDGIIIDGNHHWLALMQVAPRNPMPMYKIGLPFEDILTIARDYPKVTYEEWITAIQSGNHSSSKQETNDLY